MTRTYEELLETEKKQVLEECTALDDYELHKQYDEMLDEYYEKFRINGLTYASSQVWKCVDKVAYNLSFNTWIASETIMEIQGDYYTQFDINSAIDNLIDEDLED